MKVCRFICSLICVIALLGTTACMPGSMLSGLFVQSAVATSATGTDNSGTDEASPDGQDTSDTTGDETSDATSNASTNTQQNAGSSNESTQSDVTQQQDTQTQEQQTEEASTLEQQEQLTEEAALLEEEESQELTDEEKEKASKATSLLSSSSSTVSTFGASSSKLASAASDIEGVKTEVASLMQQRVAAVLGTFDLNVEARLAQLKASSKDSEISGLGNVDFGSLFMGDTELEDLQDYALSLNEEKSAADIAASEASATAESFSAQVDAIDSSIDAVKDQVSDIVATGNEAAYSLESADSSSRTDEQEAAAQIEGIDETKPDAAAIVTTYNQACSGNNASRSAARESLSTWYDTVSALSGVESSLIFGTGDDFALSEDEFVAKWGAAIDEFYEQFATTAGFTPPLKGQGSIMAKYAYEYKIDPRLCAAVSIAESSGGQYCIKSCNAWGWGAADSDPYGGAASWGSWEEAIQAWHQGLAESTTGMASAGSVSALGEIYCSTATWAATVTEQMEKISACAA